MDGCRDTRQSAAKESRDDLHSQSESTASSQEASCKVLVRTKHSKFPDYITGRHLRQHFIDFKDGIIKAEIICDPETEKGRVGCITFSSQAVAEDAISTLEGSKLQGKFKLIFQFNRGRREQVKEDRHSSQPDTNKTLPSVYQLPSPGLASNASVASTPPKVGVSTHMQQPLTSFGSGKILQQLQPMSLSTSPTSSDSVTKTAPPELPSSPDHKWCQAMSLSLYQLIKKMCWDDINQFEKNGGLFTYTEGRAIIVAPKQVSLSRFFNEVVNNFEECTMTLKPEQWDRLMSVSPQAGTSLFHQLFTSSPNLQTHLFHDQTAIVFTGTRNTVQSAHKHLIAILNKELYINRIQLQALLYLFPRLSVELSKKYNITMVGFHKRSTIIRFDGFPTAVRDARQEVEKILSNFVMQEIPFQHPTVLLDSLKKRFQQEDIHVYLDQLPEATSSLHMYSFSRVHLNHALRILEDKPFESRIQIYPGTDLTKLTDACNAAILKEGYSVILLMPTKDRGTEGELVVYGFLKQEVQSSQQLLETLVDHFTVKIAPLRCTPEQMAYVKHFLLENPTQEAQLLLEDIAPHVQVTSQADTVLLSGTSEAIQKANTQIFESHLFQGVFFDTTPFNCHSDFLAQIQHYIIKPLEREGNLNVLFTYNKFPSSTEGSTTTFSISVFSRKVEDLAQASNHLKAVDPQTKSLKIHPEALPHLKTIADQLEAKFKTRISHCSEPTPTVVINGLCKQETEDCCREVKGYIESNIIISEQIQVDQFQAKYLQTNHGKDIHEMRQNCEVHFSPTNTEQSDISQEQNLTITIKGYVRYVEMASERIKNLCSSYHREICQLECPTRHVSVWRKRWKELKRKCEEKYDLMLDFKHNEATPMGKDSTTLVTFFLYGSDSLRIAAVKERLLTQENGQSVQEKQMQLSDKEMATMLTGLQRKELDPEGRYCITLDIDRESNLITLTVPTSARHDLVHAEKDIINFIDKHISTKKVIPCNDLIVGWVLSSRYLRAIEISAAQCEVSLHFQENPQPAIELQGSRYGVQTVQQKIQSVFKQVLLIVTDDELLVSPSFLPVFYKPDFIHFASKLEEELCVACIYPKPRKVIREVVLQPSSFAHTLTFQICSGYLVTEVVDAIVNPTSEDLLHHSNLAKAIADAGGPSVQSESTKYVQKHGKLSPGDAVCLRSGDLPCSHIIHTVKPQLKEAKEDLLHATYFAVLNSLECAHRNAICSIALPAIGADVFGVPSYECAKTSMNAVCNFCQMHQEASIKTVGFMLFNDPTVNVFTKVFDSGIFIDQSVPAPSRTCSASPHMYWFWQNDQGHFSRFSQEVEKILTAEYNKFPKGHHHLQINGQHYEINFQRMTQKNMRTGFTREIRKQKSTAASAPSGASCRDVDENLPNLKQLVVSIRGPRDNLPEAKSRIKAKLKNSEITSYDILLPLMITSLQERQLQAIASNHNVGCDIQETTAEAATKHTEPGSQSRMVLRLKGHTKSLQRAACDIYSQIKEFEIAHDKAKGQYPPEWEKQTETIEVFGVQPGTPEWNQVDKLFKSTMMNTKVTCIKRIQNKWLWEKYIQHKTRMNRKNDGRVHERKLFHGTSDTRPEKIYQSEEGFDMRFSRDGMWGQANYFAVAANYSDQYAYQRSDGQREILLAKVLTGDSYCCEPDSSLRFPPLKYSGSETQIGQVRYDTITGYIRGSQVTVQVYMTYSNEKAYPAYLIRYSRR